MATLRTLTPELPEFAAPLIGAYQAGQEMRRQRLADVLAQKQQARVEKEALRQDQYKNTLRGLLGVNIDEAGNVNAPQLGRDLSRLGYGIEAQPIVSGFETQRMAREKGEREAEEFGSKRAEEERGRMAPWMRAVAPELRGSMLREHFKKTKGLEEYAEDIPDVIPDEALEMFGVSPTEMKKFETANVMAGLAQRKEARAETQKEIANKLAQAKLALDIKRGEREERKTEAELAKKEVDLPAVQAKADESISVIDQIIGNKEKRIPEHPGFRTSVGAKGLSSLFGLKEEPISGTEAADFMALYNQVKGGAFMEAVQAMKGTGALSDKEGQAAAKAVTRMNIAQSEPAFIQAAKEFRNIIENRKGRVAEKAGKTGSYRETPKITNDDPLGLGF